MRILIRYMPSTFAPAVLAAGLLALASPAHATNYSVGPDSACTHSTLAGALAAAVADGSAGPHTIQLLQGERAEHSLEIADPAQDIVIDGGYQHCLLVLPQIGVTTLNAEGNGRIFNINNAVGYLRRTVTLRRLTLKGGDSGFGGAIIVRGRATVALESGVTITNNHAQRGGGIDMLSSTSPQSSPRLEIRENAVISHNEAPQGGGVYAERAQVRIESAEISHNTAGWNGGGIYLVNAELSMHVAGSDSVLFQSNTAGGATFETSRGFGGAIYSDQGTITTTVAGPPRVALGFSGNTANFGGAIYARGSDDPSHEFTDIVLRNALFQVNESLGEGGALYLRDAVDFRLTTSRPGPCDNFARGGAFLSTQGLCSGFLSNSTGNFVSGPDGGGVAYLTHAAGASRPALRVAGALFVSNRDEGTAAVVAARDDSAVRLLRNVFVGNKANDTTGTRHMIQSEADVLFAYNTVLDHPNIDALLTSAGNEVNVTGSILHSPGTDLITVATTMVHNGCLLAHTVAGVPDSGSDGVIIGQDPGVGYPGSRLHKDSPAVDVCDEGVGDNFWSSDLDGHRLSAPVNVRSPGDQVLGPYDLGAIELRGSIFSDRFEKP